MMERGKMNEGNEIAFIDLFSGIGGFRLGLEKANKVVRTGVNQRHSTNLEEEESWEQSIGGFRCVWSCDNNKYANQVYLRHWPNCNHHSGNIREVIAAEIPDFDLLCAGFPCQAFSVAGKRKGFKDTRGTLFFEIIRITKNKRPMLLLLENVKGLLSHDEGLTFQIILESLDELGYDVEWQVLNSKHFGVPQTRERVFIVGHLRGTGGREIFPITATGGHLVGAQEEASGSGARVRDEHNSISRSLRVGGSSKEENLIYRHPLDYGKKSVYKQDECYPTLRTIQRNPPPKLFHQNIGKNVSIRDESVALRRGASHNYQGIIEGARIRRLTPTECERLQGFPDGWTEGISDTQRSKCLGNAVTVNVIEFLGRRILMPSIQSIEDWKPLREVFT